MTRFVLRSGEVFESERDPSDFDTFCYEKNGQEQTCHLLSFQSEISFLMMLGDDLNLSYEPLQSKTWSDWRTLRNNCVKTQWNPSCMNRKDSLDSRHGGQQQTASTGSSDRAGSADSEPQWRGIKSSDCTDFWAVQTTRRRSVNQRIRFCSSSRSDSYAAQRPSVTVQHWDWSQTRYWPPPRASMVEPLDVRQMRLEWAIEMQLRVFWSTSANLRLSINCKSSKLFSLKKIKL